MMAKQARAAARALAKLTTAEKNECLIAMAEALEQNRDDIKKANARDMETSAQLGLSAAMLDRLRLDDSRIAAMAAWRSSPRDWSRTVSASEDDTLAACGGFLV